MTSSERRLQTLLGHLKGAHEGGVVPSPVAGAASQSTPSCSRYLYSLDSTCEGVLDAEQRDFYERNGYFVVPGLVSKEKLDRFRERFREICSNEEKVPGLTIMKDVAIAKSEFKGGEKAVTKIQDFQVRGRREGERERERNYHL